MRKNSSNTLPYKIALAVACLALFLSGCTYVQTAWHKIAPGSSLVLSDACTYLSSDEIASVTGDTIKLKQKYVRPSKAGVDPASATGGSDCAFQVMKVTGMRQSGYVYVQLITSDEFDAMSSKGEYQSVSPQSGLVTGGNVAGFGNRNAMALWNATTGSLFVPKGDVAIGIQVPFVVGQLSTLDAARELASRALARLPSR